MKTDQEILDKFGEIIIREVFDNHFGFIKNDISDLIQTEGYKNLFKKISNTQKEELENYTKELLKGSLFDFLKIFEENENFKLVYEENGKQVNLVEISEMLKAEPIIENGWIARFSKFKDS